MTLPLLFFGSSVFLLLTLAIILLVVVAQKRYLRHREQLEQELQLSLSKAAIQSQEAERQRIAEELHDDVAATLFTARLLLSNPQLPDPDGHRREETCQLLDQSIDKIRQIGHSLQPGILRHLGLAPALEALARLAERSGRLRVSFQTDTPATRRSPDTELAAYRIVQELLTNLLRHSGATRLSLSVTHPGPSVCVELLHDGDGLTPARFQAALRAPDGTGLKNIMSRLRLTGGELRFERLHDGRFAARLRVSD